MCVNIYVCVCVRAHDDPSVEYVRTHEQALDCLSNREIVDASRGRKQCLY